MPHREPGAIRHVAFDQPERLNAFDAADLVRLEAELAASTTCATIRRRRGRWCCRGRAARSVPAPTSDSSPR